MGFFMWDISAAPPVPTSFYSPTLDFKITLSSTLNAFPLLSKLPSPSQEARLIFVHSLTARSLLPKDVMHAADGGHTEAVRVLAGRGVALDVQDEVGVARI